MKKFIFIKIGLIFYNSNRRKYIKVQSLFFSKKLFKIFLSSRITFKKVTRPLILRLAHDIDFLPHLQNRIRKVHTLNSLEIYMLFQKKL